MGKTSFIMVLMISSLVGQTVLAESRPENLSENVSENLDESRCLIKIQTEWNTGGSETSERSYRAKDAKACENFGAIFRSEVVSEAKSRKVTHKFFPRMVNSVQDSSAKVGNQETAGPRKVKVSK